MSATLAPRGFYRLVEDNDKEIEENQPDEGPTPIPTTQEMAKPENWVHYTQSILNNCRCTHLDEEPPEGEEIEPEEFKKRIEAADPSEPRLKLITGDSKVKGGAGAWVVRMYGDSTDYKQANPALPAVNYGVAVAKSLWWPGAHNFFNQGRWFQIYVGNGLKYESVSYYPIFPPVVLDEPVEKETYKEPNGEKPPEDENKEGEVKE